MDVLSFPPGDPKLVDQIVNEFLSQGKFDQLRKECMADVDTKPAYQNLQQRVESTVASFLKKQIWTPDLVKNQLRDSLKKHILESGFLEAGINRIVDQVVNPKILATVFLPQVEEVVYNYLGVPKRVISGKNESPNRPKYIPPLLELKFDEMKIEPPSDEDKHTDKSNTKKVDIKEEITKTNVHIADVHMKSNTPPPPGEENLSRISNESRISGISELTEHGSVVEDSTCKEKVCDESMDVKSDENMLRMVVDSDSDDDLIRDQMSPISVRESSPEVTTVQQQPRNLYSSDSGSETKGKGVRSRSRDGDKKREKPSTSQKTEHRSDKDETRKHSQSKRERSRDRKERRDDRKDSKKDEKRSKKEERSEKDEKDKKKKSRVTEDHGKEKREKDERRSTDRDSRERDEQGNVSSSKKTKDSKRREERKSESGKKEKRKSEKESKDGNVSEKINVNKSLGLSNDNVELVLKLKKPKTATNFKELCKIRKLRKKMNQMEKNFKNQIENLMADFEGNENEWKAEKPFKMDEFVPVSIVSDETVEPLLIINNEDTVEQESKTTRKDYTQLCKDGKFKKVEFPPHVDFTFPQFDDTTGFRYFEEWEASHFEFEIDYKEFAMSLDVGDLTDEDSDDDDEDGCSSREFNRNFFDCYSKGDSNCIGVCEYDEVTEEFYCKVSEDEQKENICSVVRKCSGAAKNVRVEVKPLSELNRLPRVDVDHASCEVVGQCTDDVDFEVNNADTDVEIKTASTEIEDDFPDRPLNSLVTEESEYQSAQKRRKLLLGEENNFQLPPSPDSDDYIKFNNVNGVISEPVQNKKCVSAGRKKPVRKEKQQKYNSSDLYKPRISFSSTSRTRSSNK